MTEPLAHGEAPHDRVEPGPAEPAPVARVPAPASSGSAGSDATDRPAADGVWIRQARHIAVVGEIAAVALLGLVLASAGVIARYDAGGVDVHVGAMSMWACAAALVGIPLGAVHASARPWVSRHRTALATAAVFAEMGCLTGLVASAGGVAGPFWLVFLPLVLLTASTVRTEAAVAVGTLAGIGVYVASVLAHTVGSASVGRLLIVLPVLPAAGYLGATVGAAVRRAAADARDDQARLEQDLAVICSALDGVASGDLTTVPSVDADAHPTAAIVAVALADTVVALRRLARGIAQGGEQVAAEAGKLLGTAEELAAGATQQTSSVTEVTTTVEQLAATSSQIAETAQSVAQYAAATLRYADEGEVAVSASVRAMESIAHNVEAMSERATGLAERTERIDRIVAVIDDLANQTNLLAFNAAIEAARAGDRGKGFANVAAEIRTLAVRARECTQRVSDLSQEIRVETERTREASAAGAAEVRVGSELARGVVLALDRITSMVDDTTGAAREISVVTDQQKAASDAVVAAMARVTQVSDHYNAASRSAADAAARLDALVGDLRESTDRFKVG